MVFSALRWNSLHGPVTLFADDHTVDYLGERGMLGIYREVRTAEIDAIDLQQYPPDLYFSLPKVVALHVSKVPVAVLDLDLFLRRPLPPVGPDEFVFAHYETPDSLSYPALAELPNPNGVDLPDWDDSLPACNMAVAAFGSQRHLDDFTDLALAYAAGNSEPAPIFEWARLTFAEQRLSAYTARRNGVTLTPLTNSIWNTRRHRWMDEEPDDVFHHTWHRKRLFTGQSMRDRYCVRLVRELLASFPQAADLLAGDPTLARYVRQAQAPTGRAFWPLRGRPGRTSDSCEPPPTME